MKKLKVIALLVCLLAGFTFAEDYYWPRTYYVSAGFGAQVSKGDFNDRVLTGKDTAGVKGDIHPPSILFAAAPDLMLGVNLGAFTFGLGFRVTLYGAIAPFGASSAVASPSSII